jgi:glycosyltransferase involved in cell wall biosynthesis
MKANNVPCAAAEGVSGLVSVVIPTYNHAHVLKQALQSVIDQTYACWEAIVVDNHSSDNTDAVVASFADPRITLLKIHNEGVIAASRNLGLRHARGEWVAFLDSDDWWSPRKLELSVNCLGRGADIVYHDVWIVQDSRKRPWRRLRTWQVKMPVVKDLLVRGNIIPNSSVVTRRQLLTKVGGLDESREIIAAEDSDAWLRIAELTDRFVRVQGCLGFYRCGSSSVSEVKDMSQPRRGVLAKYNHHLNQIEQRQASALLAYTAGRYLYLKGERRAAKAKLRESLHSIRFAVKLKSLWMLLGIRVQEMVGRQVEVQA